MIERKKQRNVSMPADRLSMFVYENRESRIENRRHKYLFILAMLAFLCLSEVDFAYAKEITILFTGETHAMLYPCDCPKEPDGGVARRAALVKELRKNYPGALLLDSGGFFAGGLMDAYTQSSQFDMQRTDVNLKAMELMKYDAVNIGDDELNFGREFLENKISEANIPFLSSNLEFKKSLPFIIKEAAGIKIGIMGLCGKFVMNKSQGVKFTDPKEAVKRTIDELRKRNASIIVLLSHVGEADDINLIKEVKGIDVVIVGQSRSKEETATKMGDTLIVRPAWEGRRMGILSLIVENNRPTDYKVREERLSDKIAPDKEVLSILPQCFSDANCKKDGFIGICKNAGLPNAQCLFNDAAQINLTVIVPKDCEVCNPGSVINYLKAIFPGVVASNLYYPDKIAVKLINDLGVKSLPVYLLDKRVEKEPGFDNFKDKLDDTGKFYMLKQQYSGISYFLDRKELNGSLDFFVSLYDKNAAPLLDMIKEYNPTVHFLVSEQDKSFDANNGNVEVEEYLRSVCVQKYYPRDFFDYISCRAKNINSSWWEDCLPARAVGAVTGKAGAVKLDTNKIKACAKSPEGADILRENIKLNKEIHILLGPAYLVDNRQVFATQGVPDKETLKRFLKK